MADTYKLPVENYKALLNAERQLHDALDDLDKAEECGIDCNDLRELRTQALQRIENIKKNYAPKF